MNVILLILPHLSFVHIYWLPFIVELKHIVCQYVPCMVSILFNVLIVSMLCVTNAMYRKEHMWLRRRKDLNLILKVFSFWLHIISNWKVKFHFILAFKIKLKTKLGFMQFCINKLETSFSKELKFENHLNFSIKMIYQKSCRNEKPEIDLWLMLNICIKGHKVLNKVENCGSY